jgi:molybdenum cofactor cytidylyltransferase
MGVPKPALPYGSTTIVGAVVRVANEAGLSPVVVVTGFHDDAVSSAVGGEAVIAHNPNPALGNVSSLLVGIDAVDDSQGAVILLGDMPEVQPRLVASLCNGMSTSKCKAGWVEYRDGRGHPLAFRRSSFEGLHALTGSKALWPFLSSLPRKDTFVVQTDELLPIDVNTPEDYVRVRQQSEQG